MRKTLIVVIICVFMAGCGVGNGGSTTGGVEKEVFPVVEKYLENAAAGNWKEVYETLSGEALAETKANSGRVKSGEKIISKNLKLSPVCKDIVEVSADFTKSTGSGFDRLAYTFKIKKYGDRWLIYNTTLGDYHHGQLKPGQLPLQSAETIKAYLESSFIEKRASDSKYLAGKLLQDSLKAKLLPADNKTVKDQEKISTKVKNIECLGIADGYAVALVKYETAKGGKSYPIEAIVDVIDVNGIWKISKIEIASTD